MRDVIPADTGDSSSVLTDSADRWDSSSVLADSKNRPPVCENRPPVWNRRRHHYERSSDKEVSS